MSKAMIRSLLTLSLAIPIANSSPAQESDLSKKTDSQLLAIVSKESREWLEQPCEIGAPVLGELRSRLSDNDSIQRADLYVQVQCAAKQKKFREGSDKLAELEKRFPEENYYSLGLYFASKLEDGDAIVKRIRSMDDRHLAKIDSDSLWEAVRVLTRQDKSVEFDRLALDWYERGKFELFDAFNQEALAGRAIRVAIETNKLHTVPDLLVYVRSPTSYVLMLADRAYSPAWPLIEQRAGDHLERVSDEFAAWAMAHLEGHESDRDRFSQAANALHFAGRFEDAIILAREWREKPGSIHGIQEGDAWAMNIQAYAYDALGEPAKADQVFDQLAKLSPEEHPWVVNFVINRAARLVGQARWQEGFSAITLARNVADEYGSIYAKMIIASSLACVLPEVGRGDQVAAELAFLREHRERSASLAAEGLMCAGERKEAAAVLVAAFKNDGQRRLLIRGLQAPAFQLFYTPSVTPEARDLMSESEELAKIFDRYARIIPERFTPIAEEKRVHWLKPR